MSTEVATTRASFTGADVDGLDHLAQEFNGAAEIVDMVKMACEVIVAAASIFGPFGAAFVAYLKGTVIPWLTKVSAALKAMSKVLSVHSSAQKDASSSTTSLPSYQGTPNLPTTSTHDAPALPAPASTAVTPTSPSTPASPGTTVAAPPTIGGTTPTAPTTTGAAAGNVPPFVQAVTALTGLVTAVDHLIHPGSSGSGTTTPTTGGDVPAPTTPTDPGTTPTTPTDTATPTTPTDTPTPTDTATPTVPGSAPVLGSTGGIDLSTLHPLHPGDTVGVLSIPVDIAPDGTVTPLIHTPLDPTPTPATPGDTTPAHSSTGSDTPSTPSTSGGGYGGGSGGGSGPSAPVITSAPPADAVTTAAHTPDAAAAGAQAEPGLRTQTIGSHDGLFTGIGQATGIGAGAAALARAVLSEARQSGDGSMLGAVPMPFDAAADGAARTEIFQGSIG